MLDKTFREMEAVDVSKYVKQRSGQDYLPWAACKQLLHDNGAEVVMFYPLPGEDGTSLHSGSAEFLDKEGKTTKVYEVVVHIVVDSLEWDITYPVMSGNVSIRDELMNQSRVHNAIARAFVKGVAMRLGLGYNLWLKDDDIQMEEDLSKHSLRKCKQRLEELITSKIKSGIPFNVIADRLGMSEDELRAVGAEYGRLMRIEKAIYDMKVDVL